MYQLRLTPKELESLHWATVRGYFPDTAYNAMFPPEGWPEDENGDPRPDPADGCILWQIPESAAWEISNQREEDPDSLYACIGGSLLEKLLALESSIV